MSQDHATEEGWDQQDMTRGSGTPPGSAPNPDEEDPFGRTTPPPALPDDEDGSHTENPHRIKSESQFRDEGADPGDRGGNDSDLNQEDSVYAQEGENPLRPHHHASRAQSTDPDGPNADPFASDDPPALGGFGSNPEDSTSFGRKEVGLGASGGKGGLRTSQVRGANQPNLHEVMFDNKSGRRKSVAASMLSNRRETRAAADGDHEDPFANFGGGDQQNQLARSNSLVGAMSHSGRTPKSIISKDGSTSFSRQSGQGAPLSISTSAAGGGGHDRSISPGTGISSEDRHNAENPEELFMPNMKREQFIPVRVARDKIKHVLSEMAAMKSMHLAALDTMEKQHAFLKAQLESATATYVKKLTGDYNSRVTALEAEYKRRLQNLNANAMDNVDAGVDEAKRKVAQLEEKMLRKVKEREAELLKEQDLFKERIAADEEQREQDRRDMKDNEDKNEEMILKVKELEMKLAMAQRNKENTAASNSASAVGGPDPNSKAIIEGLEDDVSGLRRKLETADIQRKALEEQTATAEEDAINLKLANSRVEKLEQENAELRAKIPE